MKWAVVARYVLQIIINILTVWKVDPPTERLGDNSVKAKPARKASLLQSAKKRS